MSIENKIRAIERKERRLRGKLWKAKQWPGSERNADILIQTIEKINTLYFIRKALKLRKAINERLFHSSLTNDNERS